MFVESSPKELLMSTNKLSIPADAGKMLSRLRAGTKLKQGDIAAALAIDVSRVSRVEKGEFQPAEAEIELWLKTLDSADATAYLEFLRSEWKVLVRPDFWHPNRDALALADLTISQIDDFTKSEAPSHLLAQFNLLRTSLQDSTDYLVSTDHNVTWVGDLAVGKSTSLCVATGLVMEGKSEAIGGSGKNVVLETGPGGITLCEVRLRQVPGTRYGILVQPQSQEEVFSLVSDLCAGIFERVHSTQRESGDKGVPQEIGRALRAMAKLGRTTIKNPDGKTIRVDRANDLAKTLSTEEQLRAEFLTRMKLDSRVRTEMWHETDDREDGLRWLQKQFALTNNGRIDDVPFPRRIDLHVPDTLLRKDGLEITAIDTKGVDGTAIRPDVRQYIDDPRTITVLCSRFGTAPDVSIKLLIEHLAKTGSDRALGERVLLLVLAHGAEALTSKNDDDGSLVETAEEGYGIKLEKVKDQLSELTGSEIEIAFFNASNEPPANVIGPILKKLDTLRDGHNKRISEIGEMVERLIREHESTAVLNANQEVRRRLTIFLSQHDRLAPKVREPFQPALDAIGSLHQRTVWASARRRGSWYNLDVYHYLGSGASADADARSEKAMRDLISLFEHLLRDEKLAIAHDYIAELRRNCDLWHDRFLSEVGSAGRELYRSALYPTTAIWTECEDLYGYGSGFRDDVVRKLRNWFTSASGMEVVNHINARIEREWQDQMISKLRELVG